MDKFELGKKRIKEATGVDAESIIKKFSNISPDFATYIIEFGYGDLFARPGLNDKTRELAIVACLIGQGNKGFPLNTFKIYAPYWLV